MILPENALELVLEHVSPLEEISRPLDKALGFCLAEEVRADRDMPPADRSAMDGYAVRASDVSRCPRDLRLVGEVAAGSEACPNVEPGTCVRIFTGANVPHGADAVVMVEQTIENGEFVTFRSGVKPGANILRRAEDAKEGALLLSRGTVLDALQVGACAAVGKATVSVHRRPRVAVLCTGEELRDIDACVREHELRNSNGPALCAALERWGYANGSYRTVADDAALLISELRRAAAKYDVIILTGGVSVGKYDFVPEAVTHIGATVLFHGVAMKPGKPTLYATLPGNRHIFGLPGNPLSAMTAFHEFALPALRRLSGVPREGCRPFLRVPAASDVVSKGGRVRFMLARLVWEEAGASAVPVESHSSSDLVAGGRADGVFAIPADERTLPAGSRVAFRPWRPL
jgi:molybdopterin molybdotransferase